MHLNIYYLGHYKVKEVVFRYGKKISLISTALKRQRMNFTRTSEEMWTHWYLDTGLLTS